MPRQKKPLEFHEGPEAAQRFHQLAMDLVQAGRPVLHSLRKETTSVTVTDTITTRKKKRRRK